MPDDHRPARFYALMDQIAQGAHSIGSGKETDVLFALTTLQTLLGQATEIFAQISIEALNKVVEEKNARGA